MTKAKTRYAHTQIVLCDQQFSQLKVDKLRTNYSLINIFMRHFSFLYSMTISLVDEAAPTLMSTVGLSLQHSVTAS
jgi:hypothetical protein